MTTQVNPTRRLVLLRHAKAEPQRPDIDQMRPLAIAGHGQAVRIAAALADRALIPQFVLCSSALRTRQTWDLIRGGLGDVEPQVFFTDQLYEAGVGALLAQVREIDDRVSTLLVVGHEPTLSRTAVRLASEASDAAAVSQVQLGMSTGTFTVLELERRWKELVLGALPGRPFRAENRVVVARRCRRSLVS